MPSLELKEEAKRRRKRKKQEDVIRLWLVGSRTWKDKRSIKKVLKQFSYTDVDFVILGTAPGLEQLALSVCRLLKFNVIILPPNVTRDDYNALYFRNEIMFTLLKPTHIFGFHDNLEIAMREDKKMSTETKSTLQLLKLAKVKKLEHQLITTKKAK